MDWSRTWGATARQACSDFRSDPFCRRQHGNNTAGLAFRGGGSSRLTAYVAGCNSGRRSHPTLTPRRRVEGFVARSDDSTCSRDSSMSSKLACSPGLSGSFVLEHDRDLNRSYCYVVTHLTSPCRARTARQTSAQQRLSCPLGARPRRLQKRPALAGFAQTLRMTLRLVVRWVSAPCDDFGEGSALFVSETRWQWENQGICIRAS